MPPYPASTPRQSFAIPGISTSARTLLIVWINVDEQQGCFVCPKKYISAAEDFPPPKRGAGFVASPSDAVGELLFEECLNNYKQQIRGKKEYRRQT